MSAATSKAAILGIVFGVILAQVATGEPLDLQDPTPRWIEVRFEVSPASEPGSLDRRWSSSRAAYLESDPESDTVRIRVPTEEIEAHLTTTGTETIPGSFSDFVWTLDARSGHVLAADLSGRVRKRVAIGPIRASALVQIKVEMTTEGVGGFVPGRGIFGLQTNTYCSPLETPADSPSRCVAVPPVRFDPASGYVNAVGSVVAATALTEITAFSPLGEAQFREKTSTAAETVVSGPSPPDALCSPAFNRPCWADLGGES